MTRGWSGPRPGTCISETGERVPCCRSCGGPDVCPSCGNCGGTVEHEVACDPSFAERYAERKPWLVVKPAALEPWLVKWHRHLGLEVPARG